MLSQTQESQMGKNGDFHMTTFDAPSSGTPFTLSRRRTWTGRTLSGLAILFLAWDTAIKVVRHPVAIEATTALGFPEQTVVIIGIIELVCLLLYLIPRTAILGAVLWTGYLGGAIATHLRLDNPLFSHTLFPIYIAVLVWGGLALRDPRVLGVLGSKPYGPTAR